MSETKLPPVARNINVFCKKCDTERYFKVITHTTATTAKLKCEVCGASQKYTVDAEGQEVKTVARKKATTKGTAAKAKSASTWLTMKEQYKGPEAVPYAMTAQFKNQQSLLHPSFGVGFVTKALPNKIEVVFSEGVKELMHMKK